MGISEFFEQVSSPGFYRTIAEEFSVLVEEIKDNTVELCDELDEIVHKENAFSLSHKATEEEMKTTVDLRHDAIEAFENKRHELIEIKERSGEYTDLAANVTSCLEKISQFMAEEQQANPLYTDVIVDIQRQHPELIVQTPATLNALSQRLNKLLETPTLPDYQPPKSSNSGGLTSATRQERIDATDRYVALLAGLCEQMDKKLTEVAEHGPKVNFNDLPKENKEILEDAMALVADDFGLGGFLSWQSKPHISCFGRGADLIEQGKKMLEKEKEMLTRVIFAASVIHTIMTAFLDNEQISSEDYQGMRDVIAPYQDEQPETAEVE